MKQYRKSSKGKGMCRTSRFFNNEFVTRHNKRRGFMVDDEYLPLHLVKKLPRNKRMLKKR